MGIAGDDLEFLMERARAKHGPKITYADLLKLYTFAELQLTAVTRRFLPRVRRGVGTKAKRIEKQYAAEAAHLRGLMRARQGARR